MSATPSSGQKAQHYIPKLYLKGFTDRQKRLWVCEKFQPIRSSRPKYEAHRPDYYTHEERGERDETAEDVLKQVESQSAPIICKLANPHYALTPERAGRVILFVAFMFVRVPTWREHLDNIAAGLAMSRLMRVANDRENFHQICAEMEREKGKSLGVDIEVLRRNALDGRFDIKQGSKAFNLGSMFMSGGDVAKQLATMGYHALYAPPGKFFVTSDSPVYTIQPDGHGQATVGMGFGHDNVEVYFPLNKKTCLKLKRGIVPKGRMIENGHVDEINRMTMVTAAHYLYSSEGYRRIARLFDERGCKVRVGENAFMSAPQAPGTKATRL
jgi:hypothetical protein